MTDRFVTFPLRDNTKLPACKWQEDSLPEVTGKNYGIHTGKSDLIVVDLDKHTNDGVEEFRKICPDGELPETFTVETPSGGLHLYFEAEEGIGRHPKLLGEGIDILGGEGFVAGPGSVIDGREYAVTHDIDIQKLPGWLKTKIKNKLSNPYEVKPGWAVEADYQDKELARKVYRMRLDKVGKDEAYLKWISYVEETGGTQDPLRPWTRKDFDRHWNGADRKISELEVGENQVISDDLNLVPLSSVKMKRVEWFWDTGSSYPGEGGRIPKGTLTIGVGRPGAGKGQFACWMAAQVTNGTLPGALKGKRKGVIFYSTEDSYSMTIAPRLVAAGADTDRVYIFSDGIENSDGKFAVMKIGQHLGRLKYLIEKYDIGLVILDPLLSAMSSSSDPNNDPSVRAEIEPLQMMLEETGCTGFGITHFRKMRDDDILNMISGSGAFARVVRSAIAFGAEKDEEEGSVTRVISTVKNNLGRTDLPSYMYTFEESKVTVSDGVSYVSKLVMLGETDTSVEDIHERKFAGAGNNKKTTKTSQAQAWLQEKLADGPVEKETLKEMLEQETHDFSWGTVEKASNGIVFSDKPYGGKARWKLAF